MVAAWVAMGAIVTAGFYTVDRQDQERCEASNEFRTHDLPQAFDTFGRFLGHELAATEAQIDDAMRRFQVTLAGDLPARDC
jgi:hypothetical protein